MTQSEYYKHELIKSLELNLMCIDTIFKISTDKQVSKDLDRIKNDILRQLGELK